MRPTDAGRCCTCATTATTGWSNPRRLAPNVRPDQASGRPIRSSGSPSLVRLAPVRHRRHLRLEPVTDRRPRPPRQQRRPTVWSQTIGHGGDPAPVAAYRAPGYRDTEHAEAHGVVDALGVPVAPMTGRAISRSRSGYPHTGSSVATTPAGDESLRPTGRTAGSGKWTSSPSSVTAAIDACRVTPHTVTASRSRKRFCGGSTCLSPPAPRAPLVTAQAER